MMSADSLTNSIPWSHLPPLEKCDSVTMELGEVLLIAGGFEERAFTLSGLVNPQLTSAAIVIEYAPADPRNRPAEIAAQLTARGFQVLSPRPVFQRFEPGDFTAEMTTHLRNLGATGVLLDISAMSKLQILLILHSCNILNLSVRVFYAEAERYNPRKEEYDVARAGEEIHQPTIRIYTGIQGVLRVDTLSSIAMQGQPTAAIAFMSFNEALTQALLDAVYPSRLFLINGVRPDRLSWREEATAWIHEQLRREWPNDNPVQSVLSGSTPLPVRRTSTIDYRDTVQMLSSMYWELAADHRILLAPTGSKMQTLGCYIIKAIHPDIHIEYPTPKSFFDLYSEKVSDLWLVRFGPLAEFIDRLSFIEREEHLGIPIDVSAR